MESNIEAVIMESGKKLGYEKWKDKKIEAVKSFTEGKDIFVSPPTGHGKSITYSLLTHVLDEMRLRTLYPAINWAQ